MGKEVMLAKTSAAISNDIDDILEKKNADILGDHPAINAREARIKFSKIVQAARFKNNRVIITEHGEPAAGVVSIEDVRILDYISQLAAKRDQGEFKEFSFDDLKKCLKLEAGENRAEEGNSDGP